MDPKTLFWSGALALMAAVVGVAIAGIRRRRRGDIAGHRRAMLCACGLVGLFLFAYVFKVFLLGHEHVAQWSPRERLVLRIHEVFIAVIKCATSTVSTLANSAWQARLRWCCLRLARPSSSLK
jgi:uncharacterized membrane protein YozB (DUF420 family)